MENRDRKKLQENIQFLAKNIDFQQVAQLLLMRKVFTKPMIDHLECYPNDSMRNAMVLSDLQTRGPTAYKEFISILELTGSIEALKTISPKGSTNHHPHYSHHQPACSRISQHITGSKTNADDKSEGNSIILPDDKNSTQDDTLLSKHPNQELPQTLKWHPFSFNCDDQLPSSFSPRDSSTLENNIGLLTLNSTAQLQSSTHDSVGTSATSNGSTLSGGASNIMLVKRAIECHENPLEDYKMTAKPRGPCLIINNIDFDSDLFPQRKGSEHDATRLKDVFEQLGFDISHERNLTAKNMKKSLKRVRAKCKSDNDALVIIILSHGSESGIYGTDGIELDFNYMIDRFDNRHCKVMISKPKIFIVQACRGRLADYGGNESSESSPSHSSIDEFACTEGKSRYRLYRERPPPFKRVNKFSEDKLPTRTDMLFCFSCLPGYVSVRNEVAGSWLGVSLSYFLMTESWDKDILGILAMVSDDIKGRISSEGHVEAIETTCLGWSKYLYFNPGIYRASAFFDVQELLEFCFRSKVIAVPDVLPEYHNITRNIVTSENKRD